MRMFAARIDTEISSLRTMLAIKSAQAKRLSKFTMCTHFTYTKDELDIAGVLASPSPAYHDFIKKHGFMPPIGTPQHNHWRALLFKFSKQVIIHNIWLHKNRIHTAKENLDNLGRAVIRFLIQGKRVWGFYIVSALSPKCLPGYTLPWSFLRASSLGPDHVKL